MLISLTCATALSIAATLGGSSDSTAEAPAIFAVHADRIFTCADGRTVSLVRDGVIVVEGRRIRAVGPRAEVALPAGIAIESLGDVWVVPGFIEPHCHIAGTMDINDMSHNANPELRVLESIVPNNPNVKKALAGGITAGLYIPGSGTNMSGFGTIFKMHGDTLDEVVVRQPGALKIAQAGNPERSAGDLGAGRMGMNWLIRWTLERGRAAKDAKAAGKPVPADLENLVKLWDENVPVLVHTQIFQVVQATIRMKDETGLKISIGHGTFDAFLNGALAAERGIPVLLGPRQIHFDRRQGRIYGCAAEYWKRGVEDIGSNTDSPVVPQEELPYQAAMAVRHGLGDHKSIPGLSCVVARALGVFERIGSISAGKDADFVVWTGDPIDPRSVVLRSYVNGELAYDAVRDGRRF
jgi:imidazolonepropionase-like amidohydrolase